MYFDASNACSCSWQMVWEPKANEVKPKEVVRNCLTESQFSDYQKLTLDYLTDHGDVTRSIPMKEWIREQFEHDKKKFVYEELYREQNKLEDAKIIKRYTKDGAWWYEKI